MDEPELERRMSAADVVVRLRDLVEDECYADAVRLARDKLDPAPATSLAFRLADSRRQVGLIETARVRELSARQRTAVCYRDGFVDRLSPQRWRLVYPGALYVLARELPGAIDVGPSGPWAYRDTAPVWWDLWPTVDHVTPRARGGTNAGDNLACVSWWRNAAKGARALAETGWTLQAPGSPTEWDGLLSWFVDRVRRRPHLAADPEVRMYFAAASSVCEVEYNEARTGRAGETRTARSPRAAAAPRRCRKPAWMTTSRGAYHSHRAQTDPTIWMAASGDWRVIQHVGRRRTLQRLMDNDWHTYHEGTSSDQLLALAAAIDDREGIPVTDPNRPCWVNGTAGR